LKCPENVKALTVSETIRDLVALLKQAVAGEEIVRGSWIAGSFQG
jgi:hypothetical protein